LTKCIKLIHVACKIIYFSHMALLMNNCHMQKCASRWCCNILKHGFMGPC